jgi:hypothetical protein
MLRDCRYRHVFTCDRGTAKAGRWMQPRNTIRRYDRPDVLERVLEVDRPAYKTLGRSAKQAAKRWR